jgi:anti-anti-sigma factor
MGGFDVDVKYAKDFVVFYPQGYINNLGGEQIERRCEDVLSEGYRKVIVNFSDSPIINSIGISFLIGMMDRIKRVKGAISFSNLSSNNSEVFEFMELSKVAPIFKTEEDAVRWASGVA